MEDTASERRTLSGTSLGIGIVLGIVSVVAQNLQLGLLSHLYTLAVLLPSCAVCVLRLHDIGTSGWWLLIGLIPLIGAIVLLVFYCRDSQPGENAYGPNPKGV